MRERQQNVDGGNTTELGVTGECARGGGGCLSAMEGGRQGVGINGGCRIRLCSHWPQLTKPDHPRS